MERLQELITQLKEQFERKASPSQMLHTTQLLEAELSRLASQANTSRGSAKVAVMMPSSMKMYAGQQNLQDPVQERGAWPYDPLTEIPTLAHQQSAREINDAIGSNGSSSLNDKLKANVLELSVALNETPVRDLKKAIGVNDRYVFINQLFRGDEVMYERSIKTINGFRILPEAEYWMERELKVKLGWDESRETTKHFYQLVKRRFS